MMKKKEWSQWAFTSALGLLLSYIFVFLAVLPIRYLRLVFGRKLFILSSALCFAGLISYGLWAWAFIHISLSLLIGLYRELEENHVSTFVSAVLAIATTVMANLVSFFSYSKITGRDTESILLGYFTPLIKQLHKTPHFRETNLESFLTYLPSGLIISLMFILFISLAFVKSASNYNQLKNFRLPDGLIWVFIVSLGFAFISVSNPQASTIATNIFIITSAAYFFQGLAVFTHFLDRFSVFGFWRILAYFIVLLQMFFISGLGVLDFWFDFRSKKSTSLERKTLNQGEK